MSEQIVVVGQIARDLVLRVDHVPDHHEAVPATERIEVLGGKGANQAVAFAQLGMPVALLGVVGEDDHVLARARADGVDVSPVVRRPGATTGLIVNVVDKDAHWHYVEHLPAEVLLTEEDVHAARELLASARATVVQLQQPARAATAAVAASSGLVVLDGRPADEEILTGADVLRADADEARQLTGAHGTDEVLAAARELLVRHGLALVAFGVAGGDAFVWREGERVLPHGDAHVVDTTGGGDAFTAALTTALLRGEEPPVAARRAVAAAAATVEHLGGRPDLTNVPEPTG